MSLFEHQIKSAVCFCHTKRVSCVFIFSFQNQAVFCFFYKEKCLFFFIFCFFFLWPFCSSVAQSHRVWIHHPTHPLSSCLVSCCKKKGLTHDEWAPRAIGPVTWQSRCSPPIGGRGNNWALWCGGEKGAPLFSRVSEPRVWQITSLHIKALAASRCSLQTVKVAKWAPWF